MADKINGVEIIELYKIARKSVEHFDKILGTFRQIIFALNGAIITAGIGLYIKYIDTVSTQNVPLFKINYRILFYGSCILGITNILVWQLEKHYHRYLIVSSKIAEKMETLIYHDDDMKKFTDNMLVALTYQFRQAKDKRIEDEWIPEFIKQGMYHFSRFVRTYDFLYMLPLVGSIFLNFFLAIKIGSLWFWLGWIFMSFIFCSIGFIIIRYSYWFTKRYRGTICLDHLKKSVWDGNTKQDNKELD